MDEDFSIFGGHLLLIFCYFIKQTDKFLFLMRREGHLNKQVVELGLSMTVSDYRLVFPTVNSPTWSSTSVHIITHVR